MFHFKVLTCPSVPFLAATVAAKRSPGTSLLRTHYRFIDFPKTKASSSDGFTFVEEQTNTVTTGPSAPSTFFHQTFGTQASGIELKI